MEKVTKFGRCRITLKLEAVEGISGALKSLKKQIIRTFQRKAFARRKDIVTCNDAKH